MPSFNNFKFNTLNQPHQAVENNQEATAQACQAVTELADKVLAKFDSACIYEPLGIVEAQRLLKQISQSTLITVPRENWPGRSEIRIEKPVGKNAESYRYHTITYSTVWSRTADHGACIIVFNFYPDRPARVTIIKPRRRFACSQAMAEALMADLQTILES